MIVKSTNEWGTPVTDIWPFVDSEDDVQGLAFTARLTVNDVGVSYQGHRWTEEEFTRLREAFEKAFELLASSVQEPTQ